MPDWWIGRKHSEETRAKMRASHMGAANAFFGKVHTAEALEKIRNAKIGKIARRGPHKEETKALISAQRVALGSARGERNPNWKGGVSEPRTAAMSTTAYKSWRRDVFSRDDYTCQACGQRGGDLEADHIKPWAYFIELRYSLANGRTLCVACHRKTFKGVRLCKVG